MRLVYLGSPTDAVPPLRTLVEAGHDVALVVTQPERRRGRGGVTSPSPVGRAAVELGLEVAAPRRAGEVVEQVRATGAELGVVVAFGQLLPDALLAAVPGGFVNVHFSLLPRWRGAAPVERAILAGDAVTGVCLMAVASELDAGPVYARAVLDIGAEESAGALRTRLVAAGTELLVTHLPDLADATPEPQRGEVTYAAKLTVAEFRLDPARPAEVLARVVRAGNPRPGAWLVTGGRRVKVWRAHPVAGGEPAAPGTLERAGPAVVTVAGRLVLDEVQPEGKRPMPGTAWSAGRRGGDALDPVDAGR